MSKFNPFKLKNRVYPALIFSVVSMLLVISPANTAIAIGDQAVLGLTNLERSANGLGSFAWNSALSRSAALKSTDMCEKGYWAHTAPDGTTGWTFMRQAGYNFVSAGENLAKGFSDDVAMVAGWMASPGHRANILNASYTEMGVGSATCTFEGELTTIVVAHYGTQSSKQVSSVTTSTTSTPSAKKTSVQQKPEQIPTPESDPQPVAEPEKPAEPETPKESAGSKIWALTWNYARFIDLFLG